VKKTKRAKERLIKPKISIITVCLNMVDYIEDTIKSIILQSYENLELIVIDGGSTDGTVEVLEKYKDKINRLIVEPDDGQYYAIQKGLDISTGDIVAWLNADDIYYPWTLSIVGEVFSKFESVDWIIGLPSYINESGQCVRILNQAAAYPQKYIRNGWHRTHLACYLQQESMFWRKSLLAKAGGLNTDLKYAADFELWTRFARFSDLVSLTTPIASFRLREGEQKSSKGKSIYKEEVRITCKRLKKAPRIWDYIASKSEYASWFVRLLLWNKSRVIGYVPKRKEWEISESYLPVSRSSFSALLTEAQVRRNKRDS
jgi:glycosyltransferase involved in cell wall biosynthesis